MMSHCILRVKKLKTFASVACSGAHTFREVTTANADASRTKLNRHSGSRSTRELLAALRERLPVKRRKDAVLCLEYLVAASPSFFEGGQSRLDYFGQSLKWLKKVHGDANVLCATVHLDETSPHLVVYVVPITADGRLAAKEFVGGASKLTRMQTDFHRLVGHAFGLVRGVQGSKARHQEVAKFYAALNSKQHIPSISKVDHLAAACGIDTKRMSERRSAEEVMRVRAGPAAALTLNEIQKGAVAARERSTRDANRTRAVEAQLAGAVIERIQVESQLREAARRADEELNSARNELAMARKEIEGWVSRFQELASRFGGLFKRPQAGHSIPLQIRTPR